MTYFGQCFNESLRIEPPVHFSTAMTLTEDAKIGQYKIKGGDEFIINHWALHHRGDQWIDHDKFIPERFDP